MPYKDPAQRRAATKRYRLRHPERMRAFRRQHYATHKVSIRARQAQWRKTEKGRKSTQRTNQNNRLARNAWRRERRQKFPELVRSRDNAYNLRHRDTINVRRRARYAENPMPRREEAKRQLTRYPERLHARFHRWYLRNMITHLIRQRAYRQMHPAKTRIWNEWRRTRKLNFPATFTPEERAFMLNYWQHSCAVCGNQEGFFCKLADDHWIPLASPDCPGTVAENMLPMCHGPGGCNNLKNKSNPETWLISRYGRIPAQRILRAVATYFSVVRKRNTQQQASQLHLTPFC